MKNQAVLFDLDGTLLPMDNDEFTRGYFKLLAAKLAPYGFEPGALVDGIWAGVAAMVNNDGSRTNSEAFWDCFARTFGQSALDHRHVVEEFYAVDFRAARRFCGFAPAAAETVRMGLFKNKALVTWLGPAEKPESSCGSASPKPARPRNRSAAVPAPPASPHR